MLLLRLWQQPRPAGQRGPAGGRKVSAIVFVESQQGDRASAGLLWPSTYSCSDSPLWRWLLQQAASNNGTSGMLQHRDGDNSEQHAGMGLTGQHE